MTIKVNNTQIERSTLNKAIELASIKGKNVIIFAAVVAEGRGKKHCHCTMSDFEASPNKDDFDVLAIVDKDGNFVD